MSDASGAPRLTVLLGGVRAGKSGRALALAHSYEQSKGVLFVATAEAFDDEMTRRIAAHQAERPSRWETLESPVDVASDLERLLAAKPDRFDVVVIDCLTLWVSNLLLSLDDAADAERIIAEHATELLRVIAASSPARRWIIVSNEVGLGVVPPTTLGRRYRDTLGRVNQLVAASADRVSLMVAGIEVPVKP
jgi:adenosyl cobinamide kinase/adenosyl cobinamide phosphate guanylyltransferase